MEEKEKLIDSDIQKVKSELEEIAKELGVPLNDLSVFHEYSVKRGRTWSSEVNEKLIYPLYLKRFAHVREVEVDNETGKIIKFRTCEGGPWLPRDQMFKIISDSDFS